MDLEDTRDAFERIIMREAETRKYTGVRLEVLILRHSTGEYKQAWVDSAWIGWCAAVQLYT